VVDEALRGCVRENEKYLRQRESLESQFAVPSMSRQLHMTKLGAYTDLLIAK
jgi:hypothetical protein